MALSPEQLEARKKYLGSSDMPAVLGVDPFQNAFAVWAAKTGRDPGFEGNDATEFGNLMEPVLLNWAEKQLGVTLERNVFMTKDGTPFCSNLDGCHFPEFIVEAKAVTSSAYAGEWGEPMTDQTPERTIIQTHHAMNVSGMRTAFVPMLLPVFGRLKFRMYRIGWNDQLAKIVTERGLEFWDKYVLKDTPPPNVQPDIEVLKRMRRATKEIVAIPDELVKSWDAARETRLHWEKVEEKCQADLIAALRDAEAGSYSQGQVTFFQYTRKNKAREASETKYRQLRLVAAKG